MAVNRRRSGRGSEGLRQHVARRALLRDQVAPGFLAAVEARIGGLDQRRRPDAVLRHGRDAARDADLAERLALAVRVGMALDELPEALAEDVGAFLVRVREDDDELLAAVA